MNKFTSLLSLALCLSISLSAQLSAPTAEDVYGGRVLDQTSYSLTADSTRVFISTESANSIFYADVLSTVASNTSSDGFQVMEAFDADAGYGSNIRVMAVHEASGVLFVGHNSGLLSASVGTSTVNMVSPGFIEEILIDGNNLYFLSGNQIHFGTLDASGNLTLSSDSPLNVGTASNVNSLVIHPTSSLLYILEPGNSPVVYKTSDVSGALSATTTFTALSMTGFSATADWRAIGFGSADRLFVGGSEMAPPAKFLRYTDNELFWVDVVLPAVNPGDVGVGVHGPNILSGLANHIYWASIYSTNNGLSWNEFGNVSRETNPNDGVVGVDPINDSIVYITTDMGIGVSINGGSEIFEANDGVLAVQVNDMDMTTDKETAWVASKSGIRKVSNYLTSPEWTVALYPNGDGSPYYSVAMDGDDTNSVYVGNVRVYKTTDGGLAWSQVFTPENAPYNFPGFATKANAIAVCDCDSALVMAGFEVTDQEEGGVFFSVDAGTSWTQLLVEASSQGYDIDVTDIAFNIEGSDTVAYITAKYDLASPQGRSIYRAVKSGAAFTVAQEMNGSGTSTGTVIVASLEDVEVSSTGDTIMAVGTDAGNNHPIAYYKIISGTGLWTPYTTSGFPFSAGKEGRAITLGVDTIYCAVDNEIYYLDLGGVWQLGYSYPLGTAINFLYFDDLLAGTSFGLFEHASAGHPFSIFEGDVLEMNNIYPNPTSDFFNVSFKEQFEGDLNMMVYALDGKLVHQASLAFADVISVDIRTLAKGTYLVRFEDQKGAQSTVKLVKQ